MIDLMTYTLILILIILVVLLRHVLKKKEPEPVQYMIRSKDNGMFLGVCKKDIIFLKNHLACFRFSDMNSGSVFLYWMIQTGDLKPGACEVVPVLVKEVVSGEPRERRAGNKVG